MAEQNPPLYMDTNAVYSGDELGLPYRDIMGEGVVESDDMLVAAVASQLNVSIADGAVWIRGDESDTQPCYRARNAGAVTKAVDAPDAVNPRVDRVVAEVLDATFSGASRLWRLRIVKGTPAAGATVDNLNGAAAMPNNAVELGRVRVRVGATDFTQAGDLKDTRPRATVGLGTALGSGEPVGSIHLWPYSALPSASFQWCDGAAILRASFPTLHALAAASGYPDGSGDGSTTFNKPNLNGRTPVGRDAAQAEFDTLGEAGGAKTHTLTVSEIPPHTHTEEGQTNSPTFPMGDSTAAFLVNPVEQASGSTGGGAAHNNLQPYRVVNFIIRVLPG